MSIWKEEAREMALSGEYSWRRIAEVLNVPKSTVSDFLRGSLAVYENEGFQGPKILFIDIETAPLKAFLWHMFQHGVALNQIESDWYILSYCAKWAHSDEIYYDDLRGEVANEDDSRLLGDIWKLLDEADFVVGQNSKRFDTKKINARLILNGFSKPSTFRQIDTLEQAKAQFGFTSRKLEYMTDKLCKKHKKLSHAKFPGQLLWNGCLADNLEAWEEMREYNTADVLSLEELYGIFTEWDNKLPNFDLYYDDLVDMADWVPNGYHYTNLGKYQRFRNTRTGQQRRGRTNLLSKEKRAQLLANIIG